MAIFSTLPYEGESPLTKKEALRRTADGSEYWYSREWSPNNPYVGLDPSGSRSMLQKAGDTLGLTNYKDSMQFEMYQKALQWESEYALSLQDRDYNSELSQAQRQRAAGLNPDFTGVSAGTSETANNEANSFEPTKGAGQFGWSELSSIISSGLSLYQGITGVQGSILSQDLATLDKVEESSRNDAVSMFIDRIDPKDFSALINGTKDIADIVYDDGSSVDANIMDYLSQVNQSAFRSKRVRKLANSRMQSYLRSADFRKSFYDKLGAGYASRISSAESKGKFDALNRVNDNEGVTEVLSGLAKVMYDSELQSAKAARAHSKYNTDYYGNLDGTTAAGAENEQNKFAKGDYTLKNQMADTKRRIVNYLYKGTKSDNKAVAGLSSALLMAWLSAESVNFSSSKSFGPKGLISKATSFGF